MPPSGCYPIPSFSLADALQGQGAPSSQLTLLRYLTSSTMRVLSGLSCRRHLPGGSPHSAHGDARATALAALAANNTTGHSIPSATTRHGAIAYARASISFDAPGSPHSLPSRLPAHPPRWYSWLPARPTRRARDDSVRQRRASEEHALPPLHTTRT
ncbi:hypothetical protein BD310DRAFT_6474 [Dichomitus squalens]|uniref:Uncharacterized protein n=1 Tax=Dichomitus squalens TaxID=114155 RepID=A0A4V2K9V7_9APHY|nr:hypothetical protein BD310DRAFT_6474 [Dichomitus squalens]